MEILYKKEKEEADQLLEQQRLVSSRQLLLHLGRFIRYVCNYVPFGLIKMKL